jgi:hypothetical protein
MALPDVVTSYGASGIFTVGGPWTTTFALPAGRFYNAYLDCGVYNFAGTIFAVFHYAGGATFQVTYSSSTTVTIGGVNYVRIPITSTVQDEAHSINGNAGTTITVDIGMSSGGGAHSFTSMTLTCQPFESLVQADVWQGTMAATWLEGYDTYVRTHLAPLAYIGSGSSGWETAVNLGGLGDGVRGGAQPKYSWATFCPDGSSYVTAEKASSGFVFKNRLGGTGTVTDWVKTRGAGPYSIDDAALHRYVGRAREHQWGFWCTDTDRAVVSESHFIYCQQGIFPHAIDYRDDADWSNLTSGTTNSYIQTPVAGNVRGRTFGAAWMESGYGVVYTDDTEGAVKWKFVGDPSPSNWRSDVNPNDRTPWPLDADAVTTGLSGQVCGMARNSAGALVAILWDHPGGGTLTAARSLDHAGTTWQTFSISSSVVPALDVPPYIVAIEGVFLLLYQETDTGPGHFKRPKFAASIDAGATWS